MHGEGCIHTVSKCEVGQPEGYRLLFLPASKRDAAIAQDLFSSAGFQVEVCTDIHNLVENLKKGAGSLLLSEERLLSESATRLKAALSEQEPWSDIPVIVFTRRGERSQVAKDLEDI